MITWLRKTLARDCEVPTLVHVTHAKAGSTWIDAVLREIFHHRVARRGRHVARDTGGDLASHYFEPGRIYPAMFMTREQFMDHEELRDVKRFIIIRDLRDTLVSLYFSLKNSQPLKSQSKTIELREKLSRISREDGLLYLLEVQLPGAAAVQSSWLNHEEIVLRYEDLLENAGDLLAETLIDQLEMPVSESTVARAVRRTSSRRRPGTEEIQSHGGNSTPGGWRNHFSGTLREAFAEKWGQLLIDTGYESDFAWAQ
jgi:lipopolysaccharide transport system ATP-binding protein